MIRAIPAFLFVSTLAFASDPLVLHDPTFYPVLEKNSKLECRIVGLPGFGFVLERGQGDMAHVTVINAGVSEGEKTAIDAQVKSAGYRSIYLQHYRRSGNYGNYIEYVIESRISVSAGYQLPGKMMITSAIYSKGENGEEKEDLLPDGVQSLACMAPFQSR